MNVSSLSLSVLNIPFDAETALMSFGITVLVGSVAITAFECLRRYCFHREQPQRAVTYGATQQNNQIEGEFSVIDLNEDI